MRVKPQPCYYWIVIMRLQCGFSVTYATRHQHIIIIIIITRGRSVPVAPPIPAPVLARARATRRSETSFASRTMIWNIRLPTRWTDCRRAGLQILRKSVNQSVSQSHITVFIMLIICDISFYKSQLGQPGSCLEIWWRNFHQSPDATHRVTHT